MTITTRPAWATDEYEVAEQDPDGTWYERPVGRGHYVWGVGHDSTGLESDVATTFRLLFDADNEDRPGIPVEWIVQDGGVGLAFASPDAMRRYAQVLLEVADDVDRVMGGAL